MSERSVAVKLTARVDSYVSAMDKAKQSTQGFSSESEAHLKKLGGQMQSVGSKMTGAITLPIVAAGGAAVKMSVDFDSAFSRMVGLAGVTADEVDGLKASILDLAGRTAQAPQDLADALYQASSSGLDTAQAMDAVTLAAEGSAAGMGSAADIVGLVASATAAYGEANITAAEATDVLTAAIREGRADPEELAGTLGRVLPIANQLGVSFAEVGGATAYLSNVFGDTNRTVTALQGFLTKLVNPSEQGRQALIDMGTSAEELRKAIDDDGLMGALELLKTHGFEGNAEAMGKLFDDIEGRQGALALMADSSGNLANVMDKVAQSTGSLDEAFDVASQTSGFKLKQAWSEMQVALIQAGDVIVPIVSGVAGAFGQLAESFSGLPQGAQMVVVAFLAVLAAAGPLIVIAGTLVKNLTAIRAAMLLHPGAAGGAVAGMALLGVAMVGLGMHAKAVADRNRELAESLAALSTVADDQVLATWNQMLMDTVLTGGPKKAIDELVESNIEGARRTLEFLQAQVAAGDASEGLKFQIQMLTDAITAKEAAEAQGAATTEKFSTDALDAANAVRAQAAETDRLSGLAESYGVTLGSLVVSEEDAAAALKAHEDAMKANEDATASLNDSLEPLVTKFDELAHAADIVDSALRRVLGGQLSMEDATRGLYAGAQKLTDVFEENGVTLDINTEAGRNNRAAVESQVEAILAYGSAIVGAGGSTDDATSSIALLRAGLVDQMVQLGLTKAEAEAYIAQLGLTPENITTAVELANDDLTREKLQAMIAQLEVIDAGAAARIQALVDQGQLEAAERALNTLTRSRVMQIIIAQQGGGGQGGRTVIDDAVNSAGGRFVGHRLLSWLGESGDEVVLPLDDESRTRQLLNDPRVGPKVAAAMGDPDGAYMSMSSQPQRSSAGATVVNNYTVYNNITTGADPDQVIEIVTRHTRTGGTFV